MLNERETALSEVVKQAARVAGRILLQGFQGDDEISFQHKGASDFVTHYDLHAEQAIITEIRREFPQVGFLGEESGETHTAGTDYLVVIDPLDGTNNFLHRIPHFSVSIAVMKGTEFIIGVVYHPVLDEMFWACQGGGSFLDHQRLHASAPKALPEMLVGTCLPYHEKGDCDTALQQLTTLMPKVSGIRTPGSAALEIAYTAMGRFDAFWSRGAKLDLWDIAAGITIAREAGCMVSDLTGNPAPRTWDSLLIAHEARHKQLRELLSS